MLNLKSFEDYVHLVLESNIVVRQRNPEKPNYAKFPIDIISRIGKVNDMWCVVINDKELAKYLSLDNDVLYIYYNIPKVSILNSTANRKNPCYYFQYSTIATKEIYKILYTKNSLYLKRKKELFEKVIQMK